MKKIKLKLNSIQMKVLAAIAICSLAGHAQADPQLDSWLKVDPQTQARIYRSDKDKMTGVAVATWDNGRLAQAQPASPGVQQVLSSEDWVYVFSTGLGSHIMGPWFLDPQRRLSFPNLPTDQHMILRLPRHPTVRIDNRFNPLGEIGMFVDGVRMFDANDAFSYSNSDGRDADPPSRIGHGDGIWNRDAYVNEGITFDPALGHQQNWGRYHYHSQPIALRYLLGDHVDFDSTTKTYRESKSPPSRHSPILGWMHDGFPIYGPYGFSNPTNLGSGIRRMISGYVPRDGAHGTDDLSRTGRHSLPAWAAREIRRGTTVLSAAEYGPNVSQWNAIGHYIEDYAFLGDLGKAQGDTYDLDETNGRWCITPEFPQGTYAYFTTIDALGKPVYPYNMGRHYHGNPTGRLVRSITEPVTTNFVARASSPGKAETSSPGTVKLQWNRANSAYQAGAK